MSSFRSLFRRPIAATTLLKSRHSSSSSSKNTPAVMSSPPPDKPSTTVSGVHQKKRIIVCCDGTWVDSDNGYDKDTHTLAVPSNVTRFCRSLYAEHWQEGQNVPQITYYQAGVGTGNNLLDQLGGGAAGAGIDEHIREAYSFVARNWSGPTVNPAPYPYSDPGDDELFLLGFSRGAYTARCIAGFISTVGLLTKRGMDYFSEIFKDYEHMNILNYDNELTKLPSGLGKSKPRLYTGQAKDLKNHPSTVEAYFNFLLNHKPEPLTRRRPNIKGLGVWDTVGSLGIPGIAVIDEIKTAMDMNPYREEMQFYDTNLSENVENAFQALALDEMRYSFTPCLWEKNTTKKSRMKQVWFPGVHSNIGGGMVDMELSDITLAWMLSQFSPYLDFDKDYITNTFRINKAKANQSPYACGNINTKDNNAIYKVSGFRVRTPGQYTRANPDDGSVTDIPLVNTRERIHPSVRIRLARKASGNYGINDVGPYRADALMPEDSTWWSEHLRHHHILRPGWKLVKNDPEHPIAWENDFAKEEAKEKRATPAYYWKCQDPTKATPDFIIEDTLGEWERRLWETVEPKQDIATPVAKEWLFKPVSNS